MKTIGSRGLMLAGIVALSTSLSFAKSDSPKYEFNHGRLVGPIPQAQTLNSEAQRPATVGARRWVFNQGRLVGPIPGTSAANAEQGLGGRPSGQQNQNKTGCEFNHGRLVKCAK